MTKKRRAPRKQRAARREDVVLAALELLGEGGVAAVSTPAIARRIGTSQSALFKHFKDKEELWRAVMDHIGAEVLKRFDRARAKSGDSMQRIAWLIAAYLQAMIDMPAMPALLFSVAESGDAVSPYLQTEISRRLGWFQQALLELIVAGQASSELREDVDAPAAASLAAGIVQGVLLRWRISGGAEDMQRQAERALRVFAGGVVKDKRRKQNPSSRSPSRH